jgi:protein-tyrosine phosphatase
MTTDRPEVTRALEWAGVTNVRDLGGLAIEAGGTTARGAIVRADNVRTLTPAGWEALAAYGIERIVDLRWRQELDEDPPGGVVPDGVEVRHVPVLGSDRREDRHERFARIAAEVDDGATFTRRLYGEYLEEFPQAFAAAVDAIATAPGPVLLHCTAGKDRTGIVVALILRVVGVGIGAVADDYALTDASRLLRGGLSDGMPAEQVRALTFLYAAPRLGMAGLLADIDARYGSAADYLTRAGLDPGAADTLRARLHADRG